MIYPLNKQIEELMLSAVDEETGEMMIPEEEIAEQIRQLELDFDEKIKALRNSYMSAKLNAKCVAAEASALYELQQAASKRAKTIENKAERIKRFIGYLLDGDKYDKDGVKVSYTTRQVIEYDDEASFVEWAAHNAPGLLNEPTVRKRELESALKAGNNIEFVHLGQKKYINIK